MKGAIFYHSSSGNTQLLCRFASQNLPSAAFDLVDITAQALPGPDAYDVVGFATWTYFLSLPPRFRQFLQSLAPQAGKPAFLLTTFGMMPGQALWQMSQCLAARGWMVLGGHSLIMPESYPPYIAKGWTSVDAPAPKDLARLKAFLAALDRQISSLQKGQALQPASIKLGLLERLIRPATLQKARQEMGRLQVDAGLCNGCGLCQAACPYQAITVAAIPCFQTERCQACWACFNHCPQQAIFTEKIAATAQYTHPGSALAAKLA